MLGTRIEGPSGSSSLVSAAPSRKMGTPLRDHKPELLIFGHFVKL